MKFLFSRKQNVVSFTFFDYKLMSMSSVFFNVKKIQITWHIFLIFKNHSIDQKI